MAAGTINTVVGSGTLITFPVLLAFGYAPVTANVTNTLGLVPGSAAGAYGYREELRGQWRRTGRLAWASVAGGVTGAVLLLELPASAFKAIVPVFIGIALVLVVVQPRLSAWLDERGAAPTPHAGWVVLTCVYLTGVYGGYFGAAQGILLLAIMGLGLPEGLQRINAVKNVLAGLVNLVAAIVFVVVAHIAWDAAALIALGATCGGVLGARVGRRLPPSVLRGVIVLVGVSAILQLLLR
jgi:uncharacterized membrane protein YfcA